MSLAYFSITYTFSNGLISSYESSYSYFTYTYTFYRLLEENELKDIEATWLYYFYKNSDLLELLFLI